jgi:hypothetical protein
MNIHNYILRIAIWILSLCLTGCSNQTGEKSITDKTISDNSLTLGQQMSLSSTDSLAMQKEELTKIYTQAISEFVKIAYKRSQTTFDTLYFGKHVNGRPDDFPEIELPAKIENTQIKIIDPETGEKLQKQNKRRVYINLFGFVDKENADFIFVIFSNGFDHQYDYFINFIKNASTKEFKLDKIDFENYLNSNGQKPNRVTIYKGGIYFGDK